MRNSSRRKKESIASDRRPPPPTPTNVVENWQFLSTPVPGRDSDASFCSSRPSIASSGRPSAAIPNINDRPYQLSALRTINGYLASQSFPISLKHPLPSAKDITETLKFLIQRLGFPAQKLDEDLNLVLKFMKCPLKLNKSALRAPGTPHSWPNLLAVIHWLVQVIKYTEFIMNSPPSFAANQEFVYALKSYGYFIRGQDEEMKELDEECEREMDEWKGVLKEKVMGLEEHVMELEKKLESMKAGPSRKQALEKDRLVLENDKKKFHELIEWLDGNLFEMNKKLEENKRALEEKIEYRKRICDENEELKRKIEQQGINFRDAERMKRELQAVERDIEETETARNDWEEKMWDIDSKIKHKLNELEQFMMNCNQALKRLKLGNEFQYQLDANGSTASAILGSDYKSILKPVLATFAENIKSSSMDKLQESISLRQQIGENTTKSEAKKNSIAALQSQNDSVEYELNLMKKEAHKYVSKCAAEARKMAHDIDMEAPKMSIIEKEADGFLQASKAQLQEITAQADEEVKACTKELFDLINSVSAYKEYMGSKITEMRKDLLETAGAVAGFYKSYHPSEGGVSPDN